MGQMESAPGGGGGAMGGSQDDFKTLQLLFQRCMSLSLLPHISCQVSRTDLESQHGKNPGEKGARGISIWILIMEQTKLSGFMRNV